MLGIILAVIAAFTNGFEKIAHKYILTREDTLSYAFVWHILSSLFFLPFFIIEFSIPENNFSWLLVIISGFLWASVAYTGFHAYKYLDVSVKIPFTKSFRVIFVLLFSVIFLKESLSFEKIFGTLLIFLGIILLAYKNKSSSESTSKKGFLLALYSTFIVSIVLLVDKYAMRFFSPGMYSFMVYSVPLLFLIPFMFRKKSELKSVLNNSFKATIISVILSSVTYYLILHAFRLEEASVVIPIMQLSILISVFGGILILKEKKDIPRKLFAAILVIFGAILISGIF